MSLKVRVGSLKFRLYTVSFSELDKSFVDKKKDEIETLCDNKVGRCVGAGRFYLGPKLKTKDLTQNKRYHTSINVYRRC